MPSGQSFIHSPQLHQNRMNRKLFLTLASLIVLTVTWRCTKDMGVIPVSAPQPAGACDTITFVRHIRPIVQAKCISCHGPGSSGNVPPLVTYQNVKTTSDDGRLYGVIIEGPPAHQWMPQGSQNGLPQNEKDLFDCWIQNGEKEN